MANQTLDNILFFSNGYGQICANDANHQIAIRADRCGTPNDYINYYQFGGTLAAGLGHKFWTGGVIGSQTLKVQFADNGNYFACNIGIGTCSPLYLLHVESSSPRVHIKGTSGDAGIYMKASTSCGGWTVKDNGSNEFTIFSDSAGSHRLYINNSGNVGIGTTSPSSKLDVSGADGRIQSRVDSSDGSTINIRPNAGKCGWISYTEDAVADRWGIGVKNGDAKLYFASGNVGSGGGTTRMVLDGSGNVGIGTASPNTMLQVAGNFTLSGGTRCILGDGGDLLIDTENVSGRDIILQSNSGQKVGVGTTSPSYRLHVNGTFYAAGSSQDYKQSICNYNTDSCMFMKLKPVTYQYKEEYCHLGKELKSRTQIGLIAEEVAESHPELAILVNEEDNKVVRNVDYEKLTIILLSELQKLRQEVDQLNQK